MVKMILRWEGLQSFENVLIDWLLMKGGNACVDILLVFRLESPSLEGYAVRCWVAKKQSGWDFQDQCSVISLKAVLEGFVNKGEKSQRIMSSQISRTFD